MAREATLSYRSLKFILEGRIRPLKREILRISEFDVVTLTSVTNEQTSVGLTEVGKGNLTFVAILPKLNRDLHDSFEVRRIREA